MKKNKSLSVGVVRTQDDFEIWEQESNDEDYKPTRKELKEIERKNMCNIDLSPEEKKKIDKQMTYDNMDMSNPYRDQSNVHLGYISKSFRWIETEVLLELIKTKISSCEWSVFFYILHLTRGHCNRNKYYRLTHNFPIDELKEMTGYSRTSITRSIKSLSDKHMIYMVVERGVKKYGINFRYDTWISSNIS